MGFGRKLKRLTEQRERKAADKEKKLWYVRAINYRGYVIEQNRGHQLILSKDNVVLAHKNYHRPLTDVQLKKIVDNFIKAFVDVEREVENNEK